MGRPRKEKFKKKKVLAKDEPVKEVGKTAASWQTLKGFRDVLPVEQKYYKAVKGAAINLANYFGYKRVETPVLEETSLFVKGTGKNTEVVEKQIFSFVDKGGDNITLRPEFTPPTVRAYLQHGMINLPQPVKLYYLGPAFRRENPQAGRLRQFTQFGLEVIGERHPAVDAELIFVGYTLLKDLELSVEVVVNSMGCVNCRPTYLTQLVNYYSSKTKQLCLDCKKRLIKNPLRLLDCKEEQCQPLKAGAPQIVDHLCEDCKTHLMKVLEYLDNWEVSYSLNPQVVRGLDYYTNTVWEYWPKTDQPSSQNALGGGGRYNNLVELLGGQPTPAAGLALGLERIVAQLKEKGQSFPEVYAPEVFLAQLGGAAKFKAMALYEQLRQAGFKMATAFYKDSLRQQLEIANKVGVKISLILGQQEITDQTILIREMESGTQEVIDFKKVATELRKKLDKMKDIQIFPAKEVSDG